jgi:hypothetical protein
VHIKNIIPEPVVKLPVRPLAAGAPVFFDIGQLAMFARGYI